MQGTGPSFGIQHLEQDSDCRQYLPVISGPPLADPWEGCMEGEALLGLGKWTGF